MTASPDTDRPVWRTALTPRWLGLLALALAVAGVMSVLGVWQYDVYRSKTASATAGRAIAPPVPLGSLFAIDAGLPEKAVGRRVSVVGTWGPAADQMFVSDRQLDGRDGFWVVTPLLLDGSLEDESSSSVDGSPGAILVIRGWVASTSDPAARPPAGRAEVIGSVMSSEAQDSSAAAVEGRVLPSLRIPTMVDLVDYRLHDAFVMQASSVPASAGGPVVVEPPAPPTDHAGLRNVAYAVQWWIFAAFTLFMWWRMVSDAHRDRSESADPEAHTTTRSEPSGTVST